LGDNSFAGSLTRRIDKHAGLVGNAAWSLAAITAISSEIYRVHGAITPGIPSLSHPKSVYLLAVQPLVALYPQLASAK
jgi:hypothetical protein